MSGPLVRCQMCGHADEAHRECTQDRACMAPGCDCPMMRTSGVLKGDPHRRAVWDALSEACESQPDRAWSGPWTEIVDRIAPLLAAAEGRVKAALANGVKAEQLRREERDAARRECREAQELITALNESEDQQVAELASLREELAAAKKDVEDAAAYLNSPVAHTSPLVRAGSLPDDARSRLIDAVRKGRQDASEAFATSNAQATIDVSEFVVDALLAEVTSWLSPAVPAAAELASLREEIAALNDENEGLKAENIGLVGQVRNPLPSGSLPDSAGPVGSQLDDARRNMLDAFADLSALAREAGTDADEITLIHGRFFDGNVELKDAVARFGFQSQLAEARGSLPDNAAELIKRAFNPMEHKVALATLRFLQSGLSPAVPAATDRYSQLLASELDRAHRAEGLGEAAVPAAEGATPSADDEAPRGLPVDADTAHRLCVVAENAWYESAHYEGLTRGDRWRRVGEAVLTEANAMLVAPAGASPDTPAPPVVPAAAEPAVGDYVKWLHTGAEGRIEKVDTIGRVIMRQEEDGRAISGDLEDFVVIAQGNRIEEMHDEFRGKFRPAAVPAAAEEKRWQCPRCPYTFAKSDASGGTPEHYFGTGRCSGTGWAPHSAPEPAAEGELGCPSCDHPERCWPDRHPRPCLQFSIPKIAPVVKPAPATPGVAPTATDEWTPKVGERVEFTVLDEIRRGEVVKIDGTWAILRLDGGGNCSQWISRLRPAPSEAHATPSLGEEEPTALAGPKNSDKLVFKAGPGDGMEAFVNGWWECPTCGFKDPEGGAHDCLPTPDDRPGWKRLTHGWTRQDGGTRTTVDDPWKEGDRVEYDMHVAMGSRATRLVRGEISHVEWEITRVTLKPDDSQVSIVISNVDGLRREE